MRKILLLIGLTKLLGACGDASEGARDGGTVGGDAGPRGDAEVGVPIADLVEEYIVAVCALQVRCGLMPDAAACAATLGRGDLPQVVAFAEAGRVRYDGALLAECLDSLADVACTYTALLTAISPSCERFVVGLAADGAACVAGAECASERCVLPDACTMACCAGTCASAPAAVGGACIDGTGCVDGTRCADGRCVALLAEGAPCDQQQDACARGTFCTPEAGGGATRCARFPMRGEACPLYFCDDLRDFCDPQTFLCAPQVPLGAMCTGSGCAFYATCTDGVCATLPQAGASCNRYCLGDLVCSEETGTCVARAPLTICL